MTTKQAERARLVIADDHELARAGLRSMLMSDPSLEIVGEAANGDEAVTRCRDLRPDLVLMDVRMPELDGMAATRMIKEISPATSVLIVTMHETPDYLLEAIQAGAAGYVLKDATRTELLAPDMCSRMRHAPSCWQRCARCSVVRQCSMECSPRASFGEWHI